MNVRARRRSGFAAWGTVFAMALVLACLVSAADSSISPFYRELRRQASSDRAFGLAEGGLVLAAAELELGRDPGSLGTVSLGAGRVQVRVVERFSTTEVLVEASGTCDASLVGGQGATCTRRLRARLALGADRRVLVLDWKEL